MSAQTSPITPPSITADVVAAHGLSPEEYEKVLHALGRVPNMVELGIFSVMWSEHCSYKSSKLHLMKLPTTAPWVICGPGENAGIIDIGDNQAAIFKMESHNHPSYIEPYQGAATGVGGILRDVFTMGARPVANLNALRFGRPDHPKMKHLVQGVVAGIGGYGNCVGVPTVGGETNFHKAYDGNILVNAMTVGVAEQDKIFYSAATGIGNSIVYVGSKTGRDGIHGATMASADFDEKSDEKRPTVQVGDPFTEKLLIEACLELMATDAIVAIQDMGAAGLTSSSVEMASKGEAGIRLNMNMVPCRETGMMLEHNGEVVCDIPLAPLADDAPLYDRPHVATPKPAPLGAVPESADIAADLLRLIACPDLASRRWIYEQYDSQVGGDTMQKSGGDAAVVRVHGTQKALAMSTDCSPRYCFADPYEGGKQAVAETFRNICAVGATPLAITNCLNFANPQRPEIMGQIVGCLEGMGDACRALDYPIVSGNVSLYNESKATGGGSAILPTPAIGGVGLMLDHTKMATIAFKAEGDAIWLIGGTGSHLGQSLWLREIHGREEGPPPPVDLPAERHNGELVRQLIGDGLATAVHDVSDGGLLVALTEMALRSGLGVKLDAPFSAAQAFGEDQGRYVITTRAGAVVPGAVRLGTVGGREVAGVSVAALREANEAFFKDWMEV